MGLGEWFVKKMKNSQAAVCASEVKMYLQYADKAERAAVLLLAEAFIPPESEDDDSVRKAFDDPMSVSRENAIRIFDEIFDVIQNTKAQIRMTEQNLKLFGSEFPSCQVKHFARTRISLQVWMATVGIRINPSCSRDVGFIWGCLEDSRSYLAAALAKLKEVDLAVSEVTGVPANVLSETSLDEAQMLCSYVPKFARGLV